MSTRLLAMVVISMMLLPAFGQVMAETRTSFSDGATEKVIEIPFGGGDNTSAEIRLPEGAMVRDLNMTVLPGPVTYDNIVELPEDEGFDHGQYDPVEMVADDKGIRLKRYSFGFEEKFRDYDGIDNASTTANILIEEGLKGAVLAINNTTNVTYVGQSKHEASVDDVLSFDGRLIKKIMVNATGSVQWGTILSSINLWNVSSESWEAVHVSINIGQNPNQYILLDVEYMTYNYSKVEIKLDGTSAWGNKDMWYDYNVTVQGFENRSTVVSAPIDAVEMFDWDPSWNIYNCSLKAKVSIPDNTTIYFNLSPDNGTSWEPVPGKVLNFTMTGNVLRWRADLWSEFNNTTARIGGVDLFCLREFSTDPEAYTSRAYTIQDGRFSAVNLSWADHLPPGTGLTVKVRRGPLDQYIEVNNGVVHEFPSLTNDTELDLQVTLTSDGKATPVMKRLTLDRTVMEVPHNVSIDVGDDGSVEWYRTGDLLGPVEIKGVDAAGMVDALNQELPPDWDAVPLRVHSDRGAELTLTGLTITYGFPPVLDLAIPQINMSEDVDETDVLDLEDHFSDDYDDGALALEIVYVEDGTNVWATLNGSMLSIALPTQDWYGNSTIRVRATDSDGGWTESNDITVSVRPVNDPPVITGLVAEEVAYLGVLFTAQVEATDVDGDDLSFGLVDGPEGMSIDGTSGLVTWMPGAGDDEKEVLWAVNVTDGELTDEMGSSVQVIFDEDRAHGPGFVSSPGKKATVGRTYTYDAKAEDMDGDVLIFSLDEGPTGMSVNASSGRVTWVPTKGQLGYNRVVLAVTDGLWKVLQGFEVLVVSSADDNVAPAIGSTPPGNAWVNKPYTYKVGASDADNGTVLTYELLDGAPEGMVMDDNGVIIWTPTEDQVGEHVIQVTVSDGVAVTPQSWTLRVHSSDRMCIISTPASGSTIGKKVLVTGLASGPRNLTRVEVRVGGGDWKQADGLGEWSLEDTLAGRRSGTYEIRARACDDITCSKEAVVKVYYEGDGSAVSSEFTPAWGALLAMVVVILILLVLDWKFRILRPRPKGPPARQRPRSRKGKGRGSARKRKRRR